MLFVTYPLSKLNVRVKDLLKYSNLHPLPYLFSVFQEDHVVAVLLRQRHNSASFPALFYPAILLQTGSWDLESLLKQRGLRLKGPNRNREKQPKSHFFAQAESSIFWLYKGKLKCHCQQLLIFGLWPNFVITSTINSKPIENKNK